MNFVPIIYAKICAIIFKYNISKTDLCLCYNFFKIYNKRVENMIFDKEKLIESIKKLANAKVLVIGDLALDEMIYGDAERISREAPVLILRHTKTKHILGGASNAAHNVSTLNNGKVGVIGVVGDDYHCGFLFDTFKEANINCDGIVIDKNRKTIVKTRISGSITTSITQTDCQN